jgi:hypothetical protein
MRIGTRRACRWGVGAFGAAYLAALAIFAIGTFGLFGQPQDPLAGVFLVPLGWPWNRLVDRAPERLWPGSRPSRRRSTSCSSPGSAG